jgi:hypothetical protein
MCFTYETSVLSVYEFCRAMLHGKIEDPRLRDIVEKWLIQANSKKPGEGVLCAFCDAEYSRINALKWNLHVSLPFTESEGEGIVGGICPTCGEHPDLEKKVVEHLRHNAFEGDLQLLVSVRKHFESFESFVIQSGDERGTTDVDGEEPRTLRPQQIAISERPDRR